MARGWESKAVEDQIGALEAEKESRGRRQLTEAEREHQARKQALLLSRARIVKDLEAARHKRYRLLLERALNHLDSELSRIEQAS